MKDSQMTPLLLLSNPWHRRTDRDLAQWHQDPHSQSRQYVQCGYNAQVEDRTLQVIL